MFEDHRHTPRLTVQRVTAASAERIHTHDCFEMVYVVSGSGLCRILSNKYPLQTGAMMTVGPTIPHGLITLPDQGAELLCIQFDVAALGYALSDPAIMAAVLLMARGRFGEAKTPGLFSQPPPSVPCLLKLLAHETVGQGEGYRTVMRNLLRLLLVHLYRGSSGLDTDREPDAAATAIVNVLPLIHAGATSPSLSSREIAAAACLSPAYFSRKFKAVMGETFGEYVQRLRVYHAVELLTTTELPIEEVAAQVGYRDPGAFRKVFRRVTGQTPSNLRR